MAKISGLPKATKALQVLGRGDSPILRVPKSTSATWAGCMRLAICWRTLVKKTPLWAASSAWSFALSVACLLDIPRLLMLPSMKESEPEAIVATRVVRAFDCSNMALARSWVDMGNSSSICAVSCSAKVTWAFGTDELRGGGMLFTREAGEAVANPCIADCPSGARNADCRLCVGAPPLSMAEVLSDRSWTRLVSSGRAWARASRLSASWFIVILFFGEAFGTPSLPPVPRARRFGEDCFGVSGTSSAEWTDAGLLWLKPLLSRPEPLSQGRPHLGRWKDPQGRSHERCPAPLRCPKALDVQAPPKKSPQASQWLRHLR